LATVNEIFGVGPAVELGVVGKRSAYVPALDPAYEFRDDLVRALLVWWDGRVSRNYLVQGPTGSGKSSLIEQFCARMGVELYRYACHQRTDFNEMLGQMTVKADGSTEFVLGPLPRAMKEGGVFALDELNFMPPGVVGALNTCSTACPC
jgi:cobaltochelatase CobS